MHLAVPPIQRRGAKEVLLLMFAGGVLGFIQVWLWFLSKQVVFDWYWFIRNSITTSTYLLLRCIPSGRYGIVFSKEDDILDLVCFKHIDKKSQSFFNFNWLVFRYALNFPTQHISFLELFWDTLQMSVSLPSNNLLEIQQLAHSLLQTVCYRSSGHVFFGQGQFLCWHIYKTLSIK